MIYISVSSLEESVRRTHTSMLGVPVSFLFLRSRKIVVLDYLALLPWACTQSSTSMGWDCLKNI